MMAADVKAYFDIRYSENLNRFLSNTERYSTIEKEEKLHLKLNNGISK